MTWLDYMLTAALHSKRNASHWFRYLRKDIDKRGILFSDKELAELCDNRALTLFQRVSLKAAFEDGSKTRQHIIGLNKKSKLNMINSVRRLYRMA